MSSRWEIKLPIRTRSETPVDALCDTNLNEDDEDRLVARENLGEAAGGGAESMGQVIDSIEGASPTEVREILNRARERAGLPSTGDVEAHEAFEQAQVIARRRAAPRPVQTCRVCGTRPTGPGGLPAEAPPVRRWHCGQHEHLAQPGDMELPPLPIDFATMSPIDPDENEHVRREDERIQAEQERKMRARREEAEAVAAARARYIEQHRNDPFINPWAGAGWSS